MPRTLGIDFGTRTCRLAAADESGIVAVMNRFAERPLPIVTERLIVSDAPHGPGREVLRFLGVKQLIGVAGTARIHDRDRQTPEWASEIFSHLRQDAGEIDDRPFELAVVTVPGCFSERQRAEFLEAARRVFPAVNLLDESLAAMMGHAVTANAGGTVLVYSLGAGMFSASVIRTQGKAYRMLATGGDRRIGGHSFDALIVEAIFDALERNAADLRDGDHSAERLRNLAENVKVGLSRRAEESFDVDVGELFADGSPEQTVPAPRLMLSRHDFEQRIAPVVDETMTVSQRIVLDAGLVATDISAILLVGASTRIPLVQHQLARWLPAPIVHAPDGAIAHGAARYGYRLDATAKQRKAAQPEPAPAHGPETWLSGFATAFNESEGAWKRGEHERAIDVFERLHGDVSRFLGNLHSQRGDELRSAGRWEEAASQLRRALEHNPADHLARRSYHNTLNRFAGELLKNGRVADARATVRQSLALDPDCKACRALAKQIELETKAAGGRSNWKRKRL